MWKKKGGITELKAVDVGKISKEMVRFAEYQNAKKIEFKLLQINTKRTFNRYAIKKRRII